LSLRTSPMATDPLILIRSNHCSVAHSSWLYKEGNQIGVRHQARAQRASKSRSLGPHLRSPDAPQSGISETAFVRRRIGLDLLRIRHCHLFSEVPRSTDIDHEALVSVVDPSGAARAQARARVLLHWTSAEREYSGTITALLNDVGECFAVLQRRVLQETPKAVPPSRPICIISHLAAIAQPWSSLRFALDCSWQRSARYSYL
jgi:hypothetical protein